MPCSENSNSLEFIVEGRNEMGFALDLDEIAEPLLIGEVKRRIQLRSRGLCDYCERDGASPACKYPARHQVAIEWLKRENDPRKGQPDFTGIANYLG